MTALKRVKLRDIAQILNGLPDGKPHEYANTAENVTYKFIQPNHIGDFNNISRTTEIKRQTPIEESYLIRRNDILLKRLNPDVVTLISEDLTNTTFSSNLFVVRITNHYYPAYIACLLENQGMAWLNGNIVGSLAAIKSISVKAIATLNIPSLEYDKQKAIGEFWLLHKKRKQLLTELIAEDQRLLTAIMNTITASTKEAHDGDYQERH